MSHYEALDQLIQNENTQFDPILSSKFVKIFTHDDSISEINNGDFLSKK